MAEKLVSYRRAVFFALVLTILVPASAFGIQRAENGAGQYLIAPFAIAANGYETVLEISDTPDTAAQAIKLRVLDRDGQPRLAANLYLGRGATWAGGLTYQDGTARLVTSSESCLLVDDQGLAEPVSQVDLAFTAGSVEVVEMGVVAEAPLSTLVSEGDCEAIAALWNEEAFAPNAALDAPSGGLKVAARVVNVGKGTFYGVPVTALTDYSGIVQHTAPGTAQPDLSTTWDAGTPEGQTRSVVCSDEGCVEDYWENPIDAASAALMVYTVRETYDISESLNARSERILTFPTRAYYADDQGLSSADVSLLIMDRKGRSWTGLGVPSGGPFDDSTTVWLEYGGSLEPLDFTTSEAEVGVPQDTRLFGLWHTVQSPGEGFSSKGPYPLERPPGNGQARLGLLASRGMPALVAPSGREYWGFPAIVATFTEYTNGVLPGDGGVPQRANYGSSASPVTTVRIDPPLD